MVSKGGKFFISCSVNLMLPTIFSLYTFLLLASVLYCSARDTITFNSSISDERGETLVSAGQIFELGFFTPNGSLSKARYVGIWYYNFSPRTVVWVANRGEPLSDGNGSFAVTTDGNLTVLDGKGISHWSTDLGFSPSNNTVKLMDSGNLILNNGTSAEILWESFLYPTDTFLPGMEMDQTLNLTSWRSSNDPATGNFTFKKDGIEEYQIISEKYTPYWKSDELRNIINYEVEALLSNFTPSPAGCGRSAGGQSYTPCTNSLLNNNSLIRLVMSFSGEIQYLRRDDKKNWSLIWWAPADQCGKLNACGKFGSCNSNNSLVCKCLPGFMPSSPDNWNSSDFSGGCIRKSQICSKSGQKETFLSLKSMKVRDRDTEFEGTTETDCRKECLKKCSCQAYSYVEYTDYGCKIWTEDLTNLQELVDDGSNLSVRVYLSDIESTTRDCETCGTNMIPYPLSTGPGCGDPTYFSFLCNDSTGQVSFKAPKGTYPVSIIYPETRKFVIQAKGAGNCNARNSIGKILQLNPSLPFHVNNSCDDLNVSVKGRDEVELDWDPPPEPTCNSPIDCQDWLNSTCKSARGGKKRCLCNANFRWNHFSLNCTQEGRKMSKSLIIVVTFTTLTLLIALSCTTFYYSYQRKRRVAERQRNQARLLRDSERRAKDLIDSDQFGEEDKKDIDVPFLDLKTIQVATDNFSDANKLGRGGFGPVYKGKFPGGQEIAVKRLSSVSGQGLEEFKNEVVLIAKLQHRNLVRLLGYCIKGEEKILLYEYMPNKSLDSFIFDRKLCLLLDWDLCFKIILGIARGLLYLHQDSRLRIIHRDLKTSNILLDEEMNPKISDFGLARIFEGKQIELSTNRVVGTYGYMSPEYANYGFFSIKSDVFSFGVIVLEVISGKRVTGFYESEQAVSLLGYAWRLWNEDKALDLMDQTLRETCNTSDFLKCVNIGLLCVQEDPIDRPTSSNVVVMLDSETLTLPTPKQPAFIVRRGPSSIGSSSSKPEACSNNEVTITTEEGR